MNGLRDFGLADAEFRCARSASDKKEGKVGAIKKDDLTEWAVMTWVRAGMIRSEAGLLQLRAPAWMAFADVVLTSQGPSARWVLYQVTKAHLDKDSRYAELRDEANSEMGRAISVGGEPNLTANQHRLVELMQRIDKIVE